MSFSSSSSNHRVCHYLPCEYPQLSFWSLSTKPQLWTDPASSFGPVLNFAEKISHICAEVVSLGIYDHRPQMDSQPCLAMLPCFLVFRSSDQWFYTLFPSSLHLTPFFSHTFHTQVIFSHQTKLRKQKPSGYSVMSNLSIFSFVPVCLGLILIQGHRDLLLCLKSFIVFVLT